MRGEQVWRELAFEQGQQSPDDRSPVAEHGEGLGCLQSPGEVGQRSRARQIAAWEPLERHGVDHLHHRNPALGIDIVQWRRDACIGGRGHAGIPVRVAHRAAPRLGA